MKAVRGFLTLLREVLPVLLLGSLIVAVVMVVELILFLVGTLFKLGFAPEVWGTYAAWASATLPALGLLTSVHIWLSDRNRREEREIVSWVSMVRRANGTEGMDTRLRNESPVHLRVTGPALGDLDQESPVCAPGADLYFKGSVEVINLEISGHSVTLSKDGAVEFLK